MILIRATVFAIFSLSLALLGSGCSADVEAAKAAQTPISVAIARGYVDAASGLVRLAASQDGIVREVDVEEGQTVSAGQLLCVTDDRRARIALATADAEVAQGLAQLDITQVKQTAAQRDQGRLAGLSQGDASSPQEVEQAETNSKIADGEYAQALQILAAARARQSLARLDLSLHEVRSPVAGTILQRSAVTGGYISLGGLLFVVAPDGPEVVRAEVDEAFANKVRPGMLATVSAESDEGKRYPASVLRVANAYASPSLNDDPTAHVDNRVVAVVLTLRGTTPLKLGQRLLVRFSR